MADIIRAVANAVVREPGLPEGVLDFVLCRADETDAHGSRILPDGVDLSRHKTNPIFLWQHQSGTNALGVAPRPEVVIGRVTDYFQTTEKLVIRVLFDMKDEMAATCYRKCVEGFLSGVSIGCRPDPEYTRVEEIDGVEVVVYGRVLLLEASLVILPSLASALVSRSQAVQLLRALGAPPVAGDAGAAPEPEDPVPPVAQETPAPVTVAQDPVPPPVETADPLPAPAAIARAAFEPPAGVVAILTRVDEDAAAVLALPGGNAPGDLHVTLAVFDPADLAEGWLDRLAVVVSGHARSHVPLEGRVGGHGRFYREDGLDVYYATPDVPGMEDVRDDILRELTWGKPELRPRGDHGYVPHVTLAVLARDDEPPPPPAVPLVFRSLSVSTPTERLDFDFVAPDRVEERSIEVARREAGLTPEVAEVAVVVGVVEAAETAETAGSAVFQPPAEPLPSARESGIVQPGASPGEQTVYTSKVNRMKTTRAYRGMIRGLINSEMDAAEAHGYCAEMDDVEDSARRMHRESMRAAMDRSEALHRLIAIDLDDDEGEGGTERSVPPFKDASLRADYAATAQKLGKLPQTLRSVVLGRFGTEDPTTVDTRAMAWQGASEALKRLRAEARAAANAAQSEERERLIAQYLDPKVAAITPAEAQEMRGLDPATGEPTGKPAWTPERISTMIRERGVVPIVEISRVAPLAALPAGTPVPGAAPPPEQQVVPPGAVQVRFTEPTAGRTPSTAALDALIATNAEALGMSVEQFRAHMNAQRASK